MGNFKFSVGPWNVHEGADGYGPAVRDTINFEEKLANFKKLGFDAIQFHDDDAVPNMNNMTQQEIVEHAKSVKKLLDKYDLKAEFVAPRLWMDCRTTDGGFTSNSEVDREFATNRAYRSIDIAKELGTDKIVLWLAREGTVCQESKDPVMAVNRLVKAIDKMLQYDEKIKVLIEPKPNEPVDRSFCPTIGHVVGLSARTIDPARVGGLLESAHAILAGLEPANEIAYGIAMGKLWGVHLNDQNGIKFDQDKSFGVENLRSAFNQVKTLVENNYGSNGEYIGLDVKAMRTQPLDCSYKHLENSLEIFKMLEAKAQKFDKVYVDELISNRNYEAVEMYVMRLLMGT